MSNAKGRKMESSSRIKDGNRRLTQEYFEDLYNINTQEDVAVHMCGFDRIRRGN